MVNIMKKLIFPLILISFIIVELYCIDDITLYVAKLLNNHPDLVIAPGNEYTKDYDFIYVQRSEDYIPYSYGDVMNIFYSIINNGWDEFTFYCPEEYTNCVKDVQDISNDATIITNINNYAHPLNSFVTINTSFSDSGEVNVSLNKLYDTISIIKINKKVDEIIKNNITDNMSIKDKIRTIHDYIIEHASYDVERNDKGTSIYESNTAYGTLFQNKAICSGYADTMAIFLSKFGVENFKISSETHVWNAVKLDNKWYHLDLTWDDPVSDYKDILDHKYFLITNKELKELDSQDITEHRYDPLVYLEFKKSN